MPTYNRADYIIETIESIQHQTYTNWELLIVDDGSTDNTEQLIKTINDERIFYYKYNHTGVTGIIKNDAIKKANAELIAFMDSDDLWPANKLETQLNLLQQYPEASFSLTGGYNFIIPGIVYEMYYKNKTGVNYGNLFIDFCKGNISGLLPTLLFKKKCLNTIGYFEEDASFTDFSFIGKLCYHFNGLVIYQQLLYRRIHTENHSTTNWEKDYTHYFKTMHHFINLKMLDEKLGKEILYKPYLKFGEHYLSINNKSKALHNFYKAWKIKRTSLPAIKKIIKAIIS